MQLSDVHLSPILNRESLVRVVEQTLLLKPDLVVITGDLIDGVTVRPFLFIKNSFIFVVPYNFLTFVSGSYSTLGSTVLSPLAALVKGVPGGVYFVTGNHVCWSVMGKYHVAPWCNFSVSIIICVILLNPTGILL